MPVAMDKLGRQAPGLVSLAKKAQFALSKHDLTDVRARVALCLDHSGSMRPLYRDGTVQRVAERILAVASQFDDDGAVDVFAFDTGAAYLGELTLQNYQGGIDRLFAGRKMGWTDYASAFRLAVEHFAFVGERDRLADRSLPVYLAFLTDGRPDSAAQAARELTAAAEHPLFWQTVGLGGQDEEFAFLRRLDTLPGRVVDNAGFFAAPDIAAMSDVQLLDELLGEFPQYLRAARDAGVLR